MTADLTLKMRAKALLATASQAAAKLEGSVRELVTMRAWAVLGYENFAEMWKAEAGYDCPAYAKIIAVVAMADEGMNTRKGDVLNSQGPDGHTSSVIGKAIGYAVARGNGGGEFCNSVNVIVRQHNHGVPLDKIKASSAKGYVDESIQKYGTKPLDPPPRARPTPKRVGAAPDELVQEGFAIRRSDADTIAEIARANQVTKSEIYRQAVAEYLSRHMATR